MSLSVTIPSGVVHESIDDEVIILNLKEGLYHTLNDSAGYIWMKIAEGAGSESIAAALADNLGVEEATASRMVSSLLLDCSREHLVVLEGVESDLADLEAGDEFRSDPSWPELQTYRDMQAALVLDPIHDVDETTGWPNPKKPDTPSPT